LAEVIDPRVLLAFSPDTKWHQMRSTLQITDLGTLCRYSWRRPT
jgi:hypothetical protein